MQSMTNPEAMAELTYHLIDNTTQEYLKDFSRKIISFFIDQKLRYQNLSFFFYKSLISQVVTDWGNSVNSAVFLLILRWHRKLLFCSV